MGSRVGGAAGKYGEGRRFQNGGTTGERGDKDGAGGSRKPWSPPLRETRCSVVTTATHRKQPNCPSREAWPGDRAHGDPRKAPEAFSMNALGIHAAPPTSSQQPEAEYETTKSKSKEQRATFQFTFQDAHAVLKEYAPWLGRRTTNFRKQATLGGGGWRTRGRDGKGPQPDQQPCLSFLFLGIKEDV